MMTICVDTSEQKPYTFIDVKKPVVSYGVISTRLETGDYGVRTGAAAEAPWKEIEFTSELAACCAIVERKSLADLYGTLSAGRDRFNREWQRMTQYGYAAIMIEREMSCVLRPNAHLSYPTRLNPKSLMATLIAWQQRWPIMMWFAPDRKTAETLTYRILERWYRDWEGSDHN